MDYFLPFIFSFMVRTGVVLLIGVALYLTVWPELALGYFAIGASVPAAFFAHRDATS